MKIELTFPREYEYEWTIFSQGTLNLPLRRGIGDISLNLPHVHNGIQVKICLLIVPTIVGNGFGYTLAPTAAEGDSLAQPVVLNDKVRVKLPVDPSDPDKFIIVRGIDTTWKQL